MRIALDRDGRVPLYAQLEEFLRAGIASGRLPVQTRLPSSRRLAADLGLSRVTVETAYADLEAEGLVRREVGNGTFVLPPPRLPVHTIPPVEPSTERKTIAFASGSGDSRRFPVDELRRALHSILRKDGRVALEYGDVRGYAPLRATIVGILTTHGLQPSPDNLLITSGSQQALALVAQALLRPREPVLVERPTYGAALELFRAMDLRIVEIPVDGQGMQVESLEALIRRHRPRLIYTIPNFHNPTGTCLSTERRRRLVAVAAAHEVPILEDDFVGDLRYEGEAQPPLKALDASGTVVYVSTFSKMLMPGLRVGMVVAEGPLIERLTALKRLTDLATSNVIQRALHAFVTVGRYDAHLRRSRRAYRGRRDAMIRSVERHFPRGSAFDVPSGGLFLWVRLPEGFSATRLLPRARRAGVTFGPGPEFFASAGDADRFMRLNFAAFTPEEISEGIRRLAGSMTRDT